VSKNRNRERAPRPNETTNLLAETRATLEYMAREGWVTSERRKGQIFWKITPLGIKAAKELGLGRCRTPGCAA
jgi:hypothetical protein